MKRSRNRHVQPSQLLAVANVKRDEQVAVVVNAGQRITYNIPEGTRELRVLDKAARRLLRAKAKERRRQARRAQRMGEGPLVLDADDDVQGGAE